MKQCPKCRGVPLAQSDETCPQCNVGYVEKADQGTAAFTPQQIAELARVIASSWRFKGWMVLLIIGLVAAAAGLIQLWVNYSVNDFKRGLDADVQKTLSDTRTQMLAKIEAEFKEPRINEILTGAAAAQTSNLMVRVITPEVEKFKSILGVKLDDMESNFVSFRTNAAKSLDDLKASSEFSIIVNQALARDRGAFFKLLDISDDTNSIHREAAFKICQQITWAIELEQTLMQNMGFATDPWLGTKTTIDTATIEQYLERYQSAPSATRAYLAYSFNAQKRFPLEDRLRFLRSVIERDPDIGVVYHACQFIDRDAKIGKNVLGFRDYLKWIDDELQRITQKPGKE